MMNKNNPNIDFVLKQVDAYNSRDIEKFSLFFSEQIQVWMDGKDQPILTGLEELKNIYGKAFDESPELNAKVIDIKVTDDTVTLKEQIKGRAGHEGIIEANVLYNIIDDKIVEMRFLDFKTLQKES